MPSVAAVAFAGVRERARLLIAVAGTPPANSPPISHRTTCLHAALALLVAGWESYLERLVAEVQAAISDPANPKQSAILTLLTNLAATDIKAFNTPNAENARNLLIRHTGYDPINDWQWAVGGLSGPNARLRLNEILRVRHSFAHGIAIPADIQWARTRNTAGQLSSTAVRDVDRFLSHMVKETDKGMSGHLAATFGTITEW